LVFTCIVARAQQPTDPQHERAAIQAVLDEHGTAWSRGDAKAAASVMTDDADWISGSGKVYKGRAAIEEMHRQAFAGPMKGSRHSHPGTADIRFLRPDVAVVDGDTRMENIHDENGKELPPSMGRYTAIFVKQQGRWKVAAFRMLPQLKARGEK
jgi:uncharacterized protein (TIGR02246 family)